MSGGVEVTFVPDPSMEAGLAGVAASFEERLGPKAVEEAKRKVPVVTGRLRDSIKYRITIEDGIPILEIFAETSYAGYVELGTAEMSPEPYLRPALHGILR